MRKLLVALAAALVLASGACAALPGLAQASSGASASGPSAGIAAPILGVRSEFWRPPGFSSTAGEAIAAAEHNPQMLATHAREHPLHFAPRVWLGTSWLIDFYYRGKLVAETVVSRAGRVTGVWTGPLARALYVRGDFATPFGVWWVLVPFSLLFLLPFLELRRPFWLIHLDGLVLLSFLVSYLLFDHAKLVAAVWMVYPPLLYLLGRMLWIGGLRDRNRGGTSGWRPSRSAGPGSLLSVPLLAGGLALLVAARIVLSLVDRTVADVGYASVVGAHQIAAGHPIYFSGAANGDTYGPIAYLAYLPFELLFPWHGTWDYLPSAHAASLAFDLVTVLGLVALGRRLRSGREGTRLGLALGWAWAACPFTLLALMMHTNDGLIAMLSVLSLLAFSSPAARGALLGLGAAAKFVPAALLGLYAGGRDRGVKGALVCLASFAAVVVTAIGLYLPSGGLTQFYDQTIGFQLGRTDVFSLWALHPTLDPVKFVIEAGVLILCAGVGLVPRRRSLVQVCALAGAIMLAVQVPAVHWFYYYIVWFMPFVLVALLGEGTELPEPPVAEIQFEPAPTRQAVPAGV